MVKISPSNDGLPWWLRRWIICLQRGRPRFSPWVGSSPGEGNGNPLLYSRLETLVSHSSVLAWRMPWTEESGRLYSPWGHRVRHDWVTNTFPLLNMAGAWGLWKLHSYVIYSENIFLSAYYILIFFSDLWAHKQGFTIWFKMCIYIYKCIKLCVIYPFTVIVCIIQFCYYFAVF